MKNNLSSVHKTAQAYNKVSNAYERGRPEYTEESVTALTKALGVRPESRVIDLGAGTGKFTKHLLRVCPQLKAVEPVAAFREKLRDLLSEGSVLEGSAEILPFADESLDAVVVANAFHWFDAPKALKEIHRVLKPGGGLGLIWLNDGVFTSDWGKEIDKMIAPFESAAPQRETGEWRRAFNETSLFTPLQESTFKHIRETTPDLVVDRVGSLSFIAALSESEYVTLLKRIKELVATHPKTLGQSILSVDCTTDIYWCFKLA
jgi:ubiquinone/menaquinone biosynthesis C-methylase UbiE